MRRGISYLQKLTAIIEPDRHYFKLCICTTVYRKDPTRPSAEELYRTRLNISVPISIFLFLPTVQLYGFFAQGRLHYSSINYPKHPRSYGRLYTFQEWHLRCLLSVTGRTNMSCLQLYNIIKG